MGLPSADAAAVAAVAMTPPPLGGDLVLGRVVSVGSLLGCIAAAALQLSRGHTAHLGARFLLQRNATRMETWTDAPGGEGGQGTEARRHEEQCPFEYLRVTRSASDLPRQPGTLIGSR